MLKRCYQIYRTEGLGTLYLKARNHFLRSRILPFYRDLLRDRLPKETVWCDYNGVTVPVEVGRFDQYVPGYEDGTARDNTTYESEEADYLKQVCSEGTDVVIVGGGWGVTAVIAAREVGPSGTVTVYEASSDCYEKIESVVDINGQSDVVDVTHAVVAKVISLDWSRGSNEDQVLHDADAVSPEDLPEADVYELDCEGAETAILSEMKVRPSHIVVECHRDRGAPKDKVVEILESRGYRIVEVRPSGHGLHVLLATARPESG